jgi:hypothetical protein
MKTATIHISPAIWQFGDKRYVGRLNYDCHIQVQTDDTEHNFKVLSVAYVDVWNNKDLFVERVKSATETAMKTLKATGYIVKIERWKVSEHDLRESK